MPTSAQFDVLPLLSVKPVLDESLGNVSKHLEAYFSAGATDKPALQSAITELHQMSGVLKMLSLDGVVVFCAEIEHSLQLLEQQSQGASLMQREALRHAIQALVHYLSALADGASNSALRLFHPYQELLQARGVEMAFEDELFFPNLNVQLPADVLAIELQSDAPAQIKKARIAYQQALLKWLRQEDADGALQAMHEAVSSIVACVPADVQRGFWWVATGLLDGLRDNTLLPALNAKKLLGRIDLQMRALLERRELKIDSIMCEMLYMLAHSHSLSDTIASIKLVYALEEYLPVEPPLPMAQTNQVLDQMRLMLTAAEEAWGRFVSEEDAAVYPAFVEQLAQLSQLAEKLDRNTLQFLCKKMHLVAVDCEEAERALRCDMDMATCLLLLANGITHYRNLRSDFQEQARILTQHLQATAAKMPTDETGFARLVELHCQMNLRSALVPLATEMQANLQQIEQHLNAFFVDISQRDELASLDRLITQVRAGLFVLSLDVAMQVLHLLQQAIAAYMAGSKPSQPEMRAIATVLSALESYAQDMTQGQKPSTVGLEVALQGMSALQASTISPVAPATVSAAVVSQPIQVIAPSGDEDEELLEIFLEEANEVLVIMRANLENCRLHGGGHDALVTIRRGFHTLKGSGRMVGLNDLGEVAWSMERTMNKWLSDEKPASAALLKMIADSTVLFQTWVDGLSSRAELLLDPTDLVTLAQRIENGEEVVLEEELAPVVAESQPVEVVVSEPSEIEPLEATPDPVAEQEPELAEAISEPEPAAEEVEPATVVIGDINISPGLFAIATEEAGIHVGALQKQLASLRGLTPQVGYDFMRSAHTLAGVNRTMGFTQIANLAYALESWLEARLDKAFSIATAELELIEQSIQTLDAMVAQVRQRIAPVAHPELIEALRKAKEIPPSIESETPAPAVESESVVEALATPEEVVAEPASVEPEETPVPVLEMIPMVAPVIEQRVIVQAPSAEEVAAQNAQNAGQRQIQDDVDEQLLPIFLEEAHDLHPQIGRALQVWRDNPGDPKSGQDLQRSLHTLKGSARMAGAMRLGELTHRVESRVDQAISQGLYDHVLWEEMEGFYDRIGSAIDRLRGGAVEETAPAANVAPAADTAAAIAALDRTLAIPQAQQTQATERVVAAMLRVRSDTVDRLVNEAGEISVARLRVETELRGMKNSLLELTDSMDRLRKQLREIEIHAEGQMQAHTSLAVDSADKFDPLEFDRFTRFQELTRFMNESVHDVQTVQQTLLRNLDETAAALAAQSHINRELQQSLLGIRMVPFAGVSERLYRIVRQTGKELGKKANLELRGTELELDRSVLEKMTAPFEHLLRNAIAHGLESPAERQQKGKSPIGDIRLSLRQEGNEVAFEFSDDGAGLNLPRLREKAVQQGLLQADEVVSDDQIMQLIFASGMSTASEVTEIAGRGVGMDVVRSEITALGGRIEVNSVAGQGARFVIRLPLTLAVTQALMVQAGTVTYAIPSVMVEQVQQLKPAALEVAYQAGQIIWQGMSYPLHYLAHLLGDSERVHEDKPYHHILLLRSGEQRIALHLDLLIGNQEAVVKKIGPQLARLQGMVGATVLGDGQVVLILNPVAMTQRISSVRQARKAEVTAAAPAANEPVVVMVVDDSLTVRKITSRFLTRQGYIVVTAKDGVDALEQLVDGLPTIMLLDVEMPRMDGFELAKRLRRDERTKNLPIIMITSRTADKHRDYAMEIGVNEYLGKPYQEEVLLETIHKLVAHPTLH